MINHTTTSTVWPLHILSVEFNLHVLFATMTHLVFNILDVSRTVLIERPTHTISFRYKIGIVITN